MTVRTTGLTCLALKELVVAALLTELTGVDPGLLDGLRILLVLFHRTILSHINY